MFKDVRVEVYTALVRSASGFIFLNHGEEGVPVEPRKDAGREDAGLPEERGERRPVEGMQQSMPDSLTESSKIV